MFEVTGRLDLKVAEAIFDVRLLQVIIEAKLRVAYYIESAAEFVPVSGAAKQLMLLAAPVIRSRILLSSSAMLID